jgi:hypothetical protein
MIRRLIIVLMSAVITTVATAQDSTRVKKLEVRGYVKDLQSFNYDGPFNELISGNLIHHRLNIRYQPVARFTAALELRNRFFWGEEVRYTPSLATQLRYPGESYDLSHVWIEQENNVLHTNIDRVWMEYNTGTWGVRLGRQRINWGIGTQWNPNDLFNTFNFLDFDYEERPASDAVKIQYQAGAMSAWEIAVARTGYHDHKAIAAARYFTNRWSYDFQFLGGWYQDQPTLGLGWSGSIEDAGWKGECQYFFSRDSIRQQINVSSEVDYLFEKGWYLAGGFLYNSRGIATPIDLVSVTSWELSPRSPMPTRWNVMTTMSKQITPLFTVSTAIIYAPESNLLLVLPTFEYSVATNIDVNLVWQSFFAEQTSGFSALSHRAFLRLKWSF